MDAARRGGLRPARRGIPWVATNTDWTIPQARGTAPGNGTLVSAVHTAVGRLPVVAGKPEVAIFEDALDALRPRAALMIGDRLDTDILGANRAGIPSLLVLTGIDQAKQVLAAVPAERPTYIVDDLRGLHEPYPVACGGRRGHHGRHGRGALAGNRLTAERGGGNRPAARRSRGDLELRRPIYALDVPPSYIRDVDDDTEQPTKRWMPRLAEADPTTRPTRCSRGCA